MYDYFTYKTVYGVGAVISGAEGVFKHILPSYRDGDELIRAEELSDLKVRDDKILIRALDDYFNGKKTDFWPIALDLSDLPSFSRDTFLAVGNIKYGQSASYRAVTKAIGRPGAYRAVGNALGRNRIPLFVPCHRVIRTNGELGGWSGPDKWKKLLLEIEGIDCK